MTRGLTIALAAITLAATAPSRLAAQIDYRNLDRGRPARVEDAYPVERYAFELVAPYAFEAEPGGGEIHLVELELGYGLVSNAQVGLELPVALRNGGAGGLAGPRLFALYNFNTEGVDVPALALRADLAAPWGGLAGRAARLTLTGIATRSWGLTRAHLNAGASVGSDDDPGLEAEPAWAVGLVVDRTSFQRSLLLLAELGARQAGDRAPTEVTAGIGARYQLTPTLVLDAGVRRRITADVGPDLGLTLGLTHVFSFAGLMPAGR